MNKLLNLKSSYSLLKGIITLTKLFPYLKKYNYDHIILNDYLSMAGIFELAEINKEYNFKINVGFSFNLKINNYLINASLIAINNDSYRELCKFLAFINHSKLSSDLKSKASDNLIVEIEKLKSLKESILVLTYFKDIKKCKEALNDLNITYYIGLSDFNNVANDIINDFTCIIFNEVAYLVKEDLKAYEKALLIREGRNNQRYQKITAKHLLSDEEYNAIFPHFIKENTNKLLDSFSNIEIFKDHHLPIFENKYKLSSIEYLKIMCFKMLRRRLASNKLSKLDLYHQRLNKELKLINEKGFADYFLIVADAISYARKKDILIGPGRGSAAGSLVAYLLCITDVDPIEYDLVFERFLNEYRSELPDIDIDMPSNKRVIIYDYFKKLYGYKRVIKIATYNHLKTKKIIDEILAAYKVKSDDFISKNIKRIIDEKKYDLKSAYENIREFKLRIDASSLYQEIYETALKLESLPIINQIHTSGIIITAKDLDEYLSLDYLNDEDLYISLNEAKQLEKLGLVKFDFLSNLHLDFISEIIELIRKKQTPFTIHKIALDDQKVYQNLAKGLNLKLFQLGTLRHKKLLSFFKPKNLEEIAIMISLVRPGASAGASEDANSYDSVNKFLNNRNHKIDLKNQTLNKILSKTAYDLLFQEQVLEIASSFAGLSLSDADSLRRAISKKDMAGIKKFNKQFIDGAINKGVNPVMANDVFKRILNFGDYGFNKSHAIAYAKVIYYEIYLKTYFPLEYYFAAINEFNNFDSKENREFLIKAYYELVNLKVEVRSVDILKSHAKTMIEDNSLRLGFNTIANLDERLINLIIKIRDNYGFNDLNSLVELIVNEIRMDSKRILNKRLGQVLIEDLESFFNNGFKLLIKAGALDSLKETRKSMLLRFNDLLLNYFMLNDLPSITNEDFSLLEKIKMEYEVFNFMPNQNTNTIFKKRYNYTKDQELEFKILTKRSYRILRLSGFIKNIKKYLDTKGNNYFAFEFYTFDNHYRLKYFPNSKDLELFEDYYEIKIKINLSAYDPSVIELKRREV